MAAGARRSVGGTLAAGRVAMREGLAANLAGSTHHAYAHKGGGFCVFNLETAVGHVRRGRHGNVLGRRDNAAGYCPKILTVKRSNAPRSPQGGSVGRVALSPNR